MIIINLEHKALSVSNLTIDDQGIFTGYASVWGVVDSDGDVVERGAFARTLSTGAAKGGVRLLALHEDKMLPVGKTLELKEDDHGLWIKGYISPTSVGADVRQLVKDGVLTGLSIGYKAINPTVDTKGIRRLTDVELYEVSIVTWPSNPAATIRNYKGDTKIMPTNNTPAVPTTEPDLTKLAPEDLKKIITDALIAAGVVIADPPADPKLEESEPAGTKSTTPATEPKQTPAEEIQRKYASITIGTGAQPETKSTKVDKGIGWARAVKSVALGGGDPDKAVHIAKKMYADDDILQRELKALSATSPSGGGYLIPETYANDVIELLYAKAVVTALGATVIPMGAGTMNLPKLTSGANASYTGELRKGNASKPGFGNIRLSAKKLTTKVIISNDLLRSTSNRADAIIRDDAVRAMALAMDRAALMGEGTEFIPKGLLNMGGIPSVDVSAAPDTSTTGSMLAKLIQANVDTSKLGWALNGFAWGAFYNVVDASGRYVYRDGMDQGKLNGHAFAVSNQLPVGADANGKTSVILGNWSDFVIGEQLQMEAEMFREGSATDESGSLISALDSDASILRIISLHDFAVRHDASFVIGKNLHTK